ncbi:hypothetical protein FNAPI_6746 [Fusarium napiforme]|uniref:Uncharacterized protein n=1 Tax=Fusarium napiforme TaxID=42672 RepID=A0A8H5JDS1_9HYPO|nr:hypothetical protein FNAPI_6746 [Fusarium napiforme]
MCPLEELLTDSMYENSANKPVMFRAGKSEPKFVSELKPVGVIDFDGNIIGVRFQNFMGDDVDAMAQVGTVPNACIYQGVKKGFREAVEVFLSDGGYDNTCGVSVPILTKEFMANLPSDNFKVEMRVRVVKKQDDTYKYNPLKLQEADLEGEGRAIIMLPDDMEVFPGKGGDRVCIILEEVPVGRYFSEPSSLVRMKLT